MGKETTEGEDDVLPRDSSPELMCQYHLSDGGYLEEGVEGMRRRRRRYGGSDSSSSSSTHLPPCHTSSPHGSSIRPHNRCPQCTQCSIDIGMAITGKS